MNPFESSASTREGTWRFNDASSLAALWPGAEFTASVSPFAARVVRRRLSRSLIEGVTASPYRVRRTAELVARVPLKIITLNVVLSGQLTMHADGRDLTARAGDVFIHRSGVFEFDCPVQTETFRTVVDPDTIHDVDTGAAALFGLLRPSEVTAAFASFASRMLSVRTPTTGPHSRSDLVLEAALLTIQRGLLREYMDSDETARWRDEALRHRMLAVIDRRLPDPNLTAQHIADELGVSRRTLFAAFEGTGLTLAALIRGRRLEAAAADLLATPTATALTLAIRYGFGSRETLARTFREHFGMTMGEYRDRHR